MKLTPISISRTVVSNFWVWLNFYDILVPKGVTGYKIIMVSVLQKYNFCFCFLGLSPWIVCRESLCFHVNFRSSNFVNSQSKIFFSVGISADTTVYDNTRRNLKQRWGILATENLLTTIVTHQFLVNTVLPYSRLLQL